MEMDDILKHIIKANIMFVHVLSNISQHCRVSIYFRVRFGFVVHGLSPVDDERAPSFASARRSSHRDEGRGTNVFALCGNGCVALRWIASIIVPYSLARARRAPVIQLNIISFEEIEEPGFRVAYRDKRSGAVHSS